MCKQSGGQAGRQFQPGFCVPQDLNGSTRLICESTLEGIHILRDALVDITSMITRILLVICVVFGSWVCSLPPAPKCTLGSLQQDRPAVLPLLGKVASWNPNPRNRGRTHIRAARDYVESEY